jgi:hypothetical protein
LFFSFLFKWSVDLLTKRALKGGIRSEKTKKEQDGLLIVVHLVLPDLSPSAAGHFEERFLIDSLTFINV